MQKTYTSFNMAEAHDITILKKKPGLPNEVGVEIHLDEANIREQAKNARDVFSSIQEAIDNRDDDFSEGLSFLDMKNDTLLSYMIDVCNLVLRKCRGQSIANHSSIERTVEYRVILEKIRAIDQKLAYQLNKLITLPEDAVKESERIDIHNLDIDLDGVTSDNEHETPTSSRGSDEDKDDDEDDENEGSDDGSEEGSGDDSDESDEPASMDEIAKRIAMARAGVKSGKDSKEKPGIYKPPKNRSVAYIEDGEDRSSKGRKKSYDDFYQDEDDQEVVDESHRREDPDKVRYEEDNYTRLPEESGKKTKRKIKTKEYRKKNSKKFKRRR